MLAKELRVARAALLLLFRFPPEDVEVVEEADPGTPDVTGGEGTMTLLLLLLLLLLALWDGSRCPV